MGAVKPKKSLGQNFLRDKNIIYKIIEAFNIKTDDFILEIGPGEGALTELLLERCNNLTAVEVDIRAVEFLRNKFPVSKYPGFNLIKKDFREIKIQELLPDKKQKIKVIGNIPYNISTDIIFSLIEQRDNIIEAQLMLQKEVAERLVASSGNKIYGITTIAVNLVGNSKILFDVSPHCFYPQPKVKSAVVKIVFDNTISNKEYQAVMEIVKTAFNQRRKQLRNSLKHFLNLKMGDRAQEFINNYESKKLKFFDKRPEMLTYKDFIELYKEINNFVLNG